MSCRVLQLEADCSTALTAAATVLSAGGILVFPTDTVYGLLAGIEHRAAYKRIFELKQRPPDKPLALLVSADGASAGAARRELRGFPRELAQFKAGLITLVMQPGHLPVEALPSLVFEIQPGPVGIRCPRHAQLQSLLGSVGGGVWGTSVNLAGETPAASAEQVSAWLEGLSSPPQLAVLSDAGLSGRPSDIVHLSSLREPDG
jgi:L-threonylcarbamoyladenylate synthase